MSICGATTTVPVYNRTVICELEHGHDGPHHGHIEAGLVNPRTQHLTGPRSYDWHDESEDEEA